jgi:hypothetical protein
VTARNWARIPPDIILAKFLAPAELKKNRAKLMGTFAPI